MPRTVFYRTAGSNSAYTAYTGELPFTIPNVPTGSYEVHDGLASVIVPVTAATTNPTPGPTPSPTPTVAVSDTFDGTPGDEITARPTNSGMNWVKTDGTAATIRITSNGTAYPTGSGGFFELDGYTTPENFDIELDLLSLTTSTSTTIARFGVVDNSNYFSVGISGGNGWRVARKVDGSVTVIALQTASVSAGLETSLKVEVRGTVLRFYVNGVQYEGDFTIPSLAGLKVGLEAATTQASSTTGTHFNRIGVTQSDAVATPTIVRRHVVLIAGQSNAEGRYGPIDPTLDVTNSRILQYGFDRQVLEVATDPLDHVDEVAGTVGLGLSFAKRLLATLPSNEVVVLVPTARGGSGFDATSSGGGTWRRSGGLHYNNAVARANAAMALSGATNVFAGVVWHQGERDASAGMTEAQYATYLDDLIAGMRASITGATATTPFVAGGLLVGGVQTVAPVVSALQKLPTRVLYTGYASADGLTSGGDNLHFDAASSRELGRRMYDGLVAAKANTTLPTTTPAPTFASGSPSIQHDGTPQVGETLTGVATVNNGSVSAHSWLFNGVAISGATSATYIPTQAGSYVYRPTATGATGTTPVTASSAAVTVAAATVATFAVLDNFDGTAAANIETRPLDSGQTWNNTSGGTQRYRTSGDGSAYSTATGTFYEVSGYAAPDNFDLEFDPRQVSSATNSVFASFAVLDNTNLHFLGYSNNTGLVVGRRAAGSDTILATVPYAPVAGTTPALRAEVRGTTLNMYVDGALAAQATNVALGARQGAKIGILGVSGNPTATTHTHISRIAVKEIT